MPFFQKGNFSIEDRPDALGIVPSTTRLNAVTQKYASIYAYLVIQASMASRLAFSASSQ